MTRIAAITEHYSTGGLLDRFLAGLSAAGHDLDALTPEALSPGEHFHTGGAASTAAFVAQLPLGPACHVLDIGCGIGGVSRAIAHATGARVTGIDLTPDFIETAKALSRLVGLEAKTSFEVGSATALPVNDRFFDVAVMVHVSMNIPDKEALFREAFRVLHPGGTFAIFEMMSGPTPGALSYPLPWASRAEDSFLSSPADYADAAAAAGFDLDRQHNMSAAVLEKIAQDDPDADPGPFGRHTVMGESFAAKVRNYNDCLSSGRTAPVEMFFKRPG